MFDVVAESRKELKPLQRANLGGEYFNMWIDELDARVQSSDSLGLPSLVAQPLRQILLDVPRFGNDELGRGPIQNIFGNVIPVADT